MLNIWRSIPCKSDSCVIWSIMVLKQVLHRNISRLLWPIESTLFLKVETSISSCPYKWHWWREGHRKERDALLRPARTNGRAARRYARMLKDHKGQQWLCQWPLRTREKMKREREMSVRARHVIFIFFFFLNEGSTSPFSSSARCEPSDCMGLKSC